MNIICSREKLKECLEYTERIISRSLTLPILNNILIKTEKNSLKITSTNLEIGITTWLPCKIIKAGELTIPIKIFYGIISSINSETINLEVKKDNTLSIFTDNYKANLKGEDAKDFPIIPTLKGDFLFEMNSSDLAGALNQVVGFVSNSETRPELTGVFIAKEKDKPELKFVSTDSFRLGEKITLLANDFQKLEFSVILPIKTALEIIRIFSNFKEKIKLILEKNQIKVESDRVEIVSRLIEGNYPDYKKLIPQEFKTEATINKDEFIKALKLVSIFSSRVNDVLFYFSSSISSKIKISAADAELGENSILLDGEVIGENLEIKFNWRYLVDGLTNINANKINLNFIDETKPCLITSPEDKNFIYLVMPIRA